MSSLRTKQRRIKRRIELLEKEVSQNKLPKLCDSNSEVTFSDFTSSNVNESSSNIPDASAKGITLFYLFVKTNIQNFGHLK